MADLDYWQRIRRGTVTRRRLLTGASLGGVGLALATACGSSKPSQPASGSSSNRPAGSPAAGNAASPAAQQAKRGGTLVRPWAIGGGGTASKAFDAGLDPHPLQPNYTGAMSMFYQALLQLNPRTIAIEPQLAQKWEQPSPAELVFHLQPNVKFHNKPPANGRLMTADDFVFSLNRVRTNDPKFQNRLLLASVDQFTAPDKATVRMTTKAPDVSVITNIASTGMAVLAPEVVEKAGKFATPDVAVGTGAFIMQSLDDTGANVVRNPDYWKPGLPYLDAVKSINIADQSGTWAAFVSGQVLTTTNPLPGPDAKKTFDEQQGKNYVADWYKDVSYTSVQENVQNKPFSDPRVTRALRLMIDHQEAANNWAVTWYGRGYISLVLPAALDGWDFTEQEYATKFLEFKQPKDDAVKEALTQLSAAGFTKDNPLKFTLLGYNGTGQSEVELHQAQLNRLSQGVVQVTKIQLADVPQATTILASGTFDVFNSNIVAPAPYDVDSWFSTMYRTGAGRNNGKYSDPTLDAMFDKQRTLFDVDQRKAYVKEIMSYMMDHSPYTSWTGRYLLNTYYKKLHNWVSEGASAVWGYNYEQAWLE